MMWRLLALAVLLPALAFADYKSTIVGETGLVLFWELDESSGTTAADSSGNSRPGTYVGSPTFSQVSAITTGTAVKSTSSSNYVSRAHETAFNFGTGPFSSEIWLKMLAGGNYFQWFSEVTGSPYDGWNFGTNGSGVTDLWINETDNTDSTAFAPGNDGRWYYVLVTRNGSAINFYHRCTDTSANCYTSGLAHGTATTSSSYNANTSADLRLFYQGSFGGGAPNFVLDETALYNVALSSTQAGNHFTCGFDGTTGCSGGVKNRRRIFQSQLELPRFRNDSYFDEFVERGYNTGAFSLRECRPQLLEVAYLPFRIVPNGGTRGRTLTHWYGSPFEHHARQLRLLN